jgi:endonuclease III
MFFGAMPRQKRFTPPAPSQVQTVLETLLRLYPVHSTELLYEGPFQLLAAVILSAQCTDERVNQTTPALFKAFPTAATMAEAPLPVLEKLVHPCGFYRMKARALKEMAHSVVTQFQGQIPRTMEELVQLRGVGRKTASVVLNQAFGLPAIAVDTHVKRVAMRMEWTPFSDPVKIETSLKQCVPEDQWGSINGLFILHGRRACKARKPLCGECPLQTHCAFFRKLQGSVTIKHATRPARR